LVTRLSLPHKARSTVRCETPALAAIREGIDSFPAAFLDQQAMEIRVVADYRDQIVTERVRVVNRLRWHLVSIAPELEEQIRPAGLNGPQVRAWLCRQLVGPGKPNGARRPG
jgi:hypothetical protein